MPTYTFRCPVHGVFEIRRKMTDESDIFCACGEKAERVFIPLGVIYRSGGFFTTDQRVEKAKEDDS